MIFRVAVREIESWLLGDAEAFAAFIGIHPSNIPIAVDELADPKQTLLNLVRRSNRKALKEALLPRIGSTASIGREYNDVLSDYVERHWRPAVARESSRSLDKAIHALSVFQPQWN